MSGITGFVSSGGLVKLAAAAGGAWITITDGVWVLRPYPSSIQ
jgi:hypothetical protein